MALQFLSTAGVGGACSAGVFGPIQAFFEKNKDTFKDVFRFAGLATNPVALAAAGTAGANQALEDATGANQFDYAGERAKKTAAIEAARQAEQQRIVEDRAKSGAAGQAGRAAALAEAQADRLRLEGEARDARVKAAFRATFGPAPVAPPVRIAVPSAAEIGKMTRGAFNVSSAQQMFGGDNSQPVLQTMKDQLAALKDIKAAIQAKEFQATETQRFFVQSAAIDKTRTRFE